MAAALSVRGLTKTYKGGKEALRGVDLEVGEGRLVGLLGPNGAGKSTLTKIACGLVRPSGGEVSVGGAAAGSIEARQATGYLAELFRFPAWLTALELLELHQRLAGSSGGVSEREELLELVGLGDARTVRVEAMSKGMQQRLGIAQAMVGAPSLLLLDEPTSALDPAGRRVVRELLVELRSRGIGVMLNSHLLGEVERVCDAVTIIDDGRVVAAGSPAELAGARIVEIETDQGLVRHDGVAREQIPELVRGLVAEGRDVFAVHETGSSLEDAYMQVVGSGDRGRAAPADDQIGGAEGER